MIHPEEYVAFDVYFASLASMKEHPGSGARDHQKLTLEQCRDMALEMIELRRKAIGKETP